MLDKNPYTSPNVGPPEKSFSLRQRIFIAIFAMYTLLSGCCALAALFMAYVFGSWSLLGIGGGALATGLCDFTFMRYSETKQTRHLVISLMMLVVAVLVTMALYAADIIDF